MTCHECRKQMEIEKVSCGFPTHAEEEERFEETYVCECGHQIPTI